MRNGSSVVDVVYIESMAVNGIIITVLYAFLGGQAYRYKEEQRAKDDIYEEQPHKRILNQEHLPYKNTMISC